MRAGAVDRLFSRALILGWLVPTLLLVLPIASFLVADRFWMAVSALTVIAAIVLCRVAEASTREPARNATAVLPPPRQCRNAVYLFSLLTIAGSVLILLDQSATLGDLQLGNLQQRYIELALVSNAGDRAGTALSTVGTILRSLVYVGIVAMVALSKQTPGLRKNFLPGSLLLAALAVSELATASRMYLVFCVTIAVVAAVAVRHRLMRRIWILFALLAGAVILFSVTTAQRMEASLGDQGLALDYVTSFFDINLQWLGLWASNQLGVPMLTGLLYLSHSLPEFSRLVADDSTQLAMGSHSLYLIVGPLLRALGYDPMVAATAAADRPGMWWGMMGDLYLDFGVAFVLAYPLLVVLLVRLAMRAQSRNIFSLTLRCLTAAMLFASPFFGVLNTYSFSYVMLLTLVWLRSSLHAGRVNALPIAIRPQST